MDEALRLARLKELAVLDTPPEPLFDSLVRIASMQCEVPIAALGCLDAQRQWIKAEVGVDGVDSQPRGLALCEQALEGLAPGEVAEVPDTHADPRLSAHSLVSGPSAIRFFAGVLLHMPGGEVIGSLYVADHRPRRLSEAQRRLLAELARAAVQALLMREQSLAVALSVRSRHLDGLSDRVGALSGILDELPAAVAMWDRDLTCVYANRLHDDWYGPAIRGSRSLHLRELLPPPMYEEVLPFVEAVLDGVTQTKTERFSWPRGPVHRRVQFSPFRDAGGAVAGFVVLATDETAERQNAFLQANVAALVAYSNDAIYTADEQGGILSWNRGGERLYGYTEAEVLGRDPLLLAPESERPALREMRRTMLERGEIPVFEGPRLRKDGRIVWVSIHAYRLPEVAGNPARYLVVQRDITPLKAAEAAARESEQRFRVLTESSPLGVFHTDAEGACTYVNEAWSRLFGIGQEEALGPGWAGGLHPDDAPQVFETWRAAAARGEPFSMRFRVRRPCADGLEIREVHSRANAVRSAEGTITGFVGVVEDVTERQQAQAALEASRESLRQLYEATPAMLHSCDEQGRLLSVSDTWLEKLGWRRNEVIGRAQGDFMAEPSRRFIAETAWPQLMKHGRVANVPLRLLPRSGEEMYVVMSARFEPQGQGDDAPRPLRVLAVMEDVTVTLRHSSELQREQMLRAEVERRAEELAVLLRERSEMLDVLAHEVRQPLNNASAALQSAQAVLGAGDAGVAARLERAAQVLANVRGGIDNTLAAAALLASDEPLAVEDADVDLLVALTLGDLDPADRLRIRVERDGATRTAAMDVSLMRLALRNLLVNALRYSAPGSPVTVAIADSDDPLALLIEVRDTGNGFEPTFVPRMFQRGARGSAAAGKRIAGGTGLGLYIVHRILQMHGGSVVLAHNQPGDVRMRLLLPPARDE